MQWTRGSVERAWVDQHLATFSSTDHRELREANIIANAQTNTGKICVEVVGGLAPSQRFAFFKLDLARYIYVEEMDFAMRSDQLPGR